MMKITVFNIHDLDYVRSQIQTYPIQLKPLFSQHPPIYVKNASEFRQRALQAYKASPIGEVKIDQNPINKATIGT